MSVLFVYQIFASAEICGTKPEPAGEGCSDIRTPYPPPHSTNTSLAIHSTKPRHPGTG